MWSAKSIHTGALRPGVSLLPIREETPAPRRSAGRLYKHHACER